MGTEAVNTHGGRMKLFTLILGAVVIGLTAHSANYQTVKEHEIFWGSVLACFIISIVFLLLHVVGIMDGQDIFGKLDLLFHIIACLLLIGTAIAFIIEVCNNKGRNNSIFAERIAAGAISILNALFYGSIAKMI